MHIYVCNIDQLNVNNLNTIPNFSQKLNLFYSRNDIQTKKESIRLKNSACASNELKQLKQVAHSDSLTADFDRIIIKL